MIDSFKPVRFGLILAVLTLLFSYSLGLIFGGAEAQYKAYAQNKIQTNESVFKSDKATMDIAFASYKKHSKRAHMHAGAIGAGMIGLVLVLGLFSKPILKFSQSASDKIRLVISLFLGGGGFLYSIYWATVALSDLSMGKHAAHENFAFLAKIGAGAVYLGVLAVLALLVLSCCPKHNS